MTSYLLMNKRNKGMPLSLISLIIIIVIGAILIAHSNRLVAPTYAYNDAINLSKTSEGQSILSSEIQDKTPHKEFTMIAEDATMEISPGERVKVWTFNGTVPGPTLDLQKAITLPFILSIKHLWHIHCIYMEPMIQKTMVHFL